MMNVKWKSDMHDTLVELFIFRYSFAGDFLEDKDQKRRQKFLV